MIGVDLNLYHDDLNFNQSQSLADIEIYKFNREISSLTRGTFGVPDTENLIVGLGASAGVSAMSISDMTEIPRATVIRKCKYLIKNDFLKLNDKKQYILSGLNVTKVLPYQREIFRYKAKFLRKMINLLIIT